MISSSSSFKTFEDRRNGAARGAKSARSRRLWPCTEVCLWALFGVRRLFGPRALALINVGILGGGILDSVPMSSVVG